MARDNVLNRIPDGDLEVHVVWMPVLPSDDRPSALESRSLIDDPRAMHYWTDSQDLGSLYGRTLRLPSGRDLAWDIYFVFDAGVTWGDEAPVPTEWVHQLGMDDRHLGEGDTLRAAVERLLEEHGE